MRNDVSLRLVPFVVFLHEFHHRRVFELRHFFFFSRVKVGVSFFFVCFDFLIVFIFFFFFFFFFCLFFIFFFFSFFFFLRITTKKCQQQQPTIFFGPNSCPFLPTTAFSKPIFPKRSPKKTTSRQSSPTLDSDQPTN